MAMVAVSDLERKLVEVGDKLSTPPSDVEELLSLLNLAENILSKVKQKPSNSTCGALLSVMKSLVAEDLMNHTEIDVKVALASCFMEITRISTPTDLYDENLMKAIFRITIDALTDIDDLSSRLHGKRVSILKTITGVQSFFMLLNLECDDLILEMFYHFLKAARQINDGIVITFMETMMTKLLNESEDVLLSRLLECVVKDIKDGLPIPNQLAEKVIGNCAEKLRPYLIKHVKSSGASCDNYGDIITTICQELSDTSKRNKKSTTSECLESESIEKVVDCRTITRKSSRRITAKKFFDEETSETKKPRRNSKKIVPATKNALKKCGEAGTSKSAGKNTKLESPIIEKSTSEIGVLGNPTKLESLIFQKSISEIGVLIIEDDLAGEQSPKALEGSCRIQGLVDEQRDQYPETNSKPKHQLPETNLETESIEKVVDCRTITRKSSRRITAKKFFDEETSETKKPRRNSKKIVPATKNALKKCGEAGTSKSAGKNTKLESPIIQKSTSETGVLGNPTKLESLIFQKSISEIGVLITEDDLAGEQSPKGFQAENHRMELDEALVGKRIKVWWPIDEKFYEGVISAFDQVTKKHTVRYADGDKEKIRLKDERWIDLEEATQ